MGKSIIQQARGRGGPTYQVRKRAFIYTIKYPPFSGEAEIINIFHSAAHSAPLLKLLLNNKISYIPAFNGSFVGQKIIVGNESPAQGDISFLKSIPLGSKIYNLERNPGDGGKMIRTSGSFATLFKKEKNSAIILMPNKKEIILNDNCRATLGVIAGDGRLLKPFVTAGKKHFKMKARNKLWPRTSAVKVNAVDHPFGSGRGKRIKSKIAKRNAPPGRKVGHLRPRRTGKRK